MVNLRANIFARMIMIILLLIVTVSIICLFVFHHLRKEILRGYKDQATLVTRELEKSVRNDTPELAQNPLLQLMYTDGVLYAFVEKDNQPYAKVSAEDIPQRVMGRHGATTNSPSVWEYYDDNGIECFDVNIPIGKTGAILHVELRKDKIDARIRPLLIYIASLGFVAVVIGLLLAMSGTHWTTREAEKVTESLRESEHQYRGIFESAADPMFIIDNDNKIAAANPIACQSFNYKREELLGRPMHDILSYDHYERYDEFIRTAEKMGYFLGEITVLRKGGMTAHMEFHGSMIRLKERDMVLVIAHDLTIRDRTEAESKIGDKSQRTQKIESLSTLAGGLANDFNNLMAGILGNSDLALAEMASTSPGRTNMENIKDVATRASNLINQLLVFSGSGQFNKEPADLNSVLANMAPIIKKAIPPRISLQYELENKIPPVEIDVAQVHQALMNLISNAAEAIGGRTGAITIRTGVMEARQAYLANSYINENLPEGCYVYLEVSDTGRGMNLEIQSKLFDPFFTTKLSGHGLGMAVVMGIVRGHQGTIKVYSEENKGSTVKILLPASKISPKEVLQEDVDIENWRGEGTILIVDDEDAVRNVTRMMLERQGFTVLTARDGSEGVDLFARHSAKIVVVMLDMTMSGMDGEEAFYEMREIRRDVKVILMSGYDKQETTSRFAEAGLAGFVSKPFSLDVLLKKIYATLHP
ncbi:MAG: response regulator [Phycisphaerae bacterium]|nr:response regulator [Phycisphaerae bacterium]